eukprot:753240-Hanusia_phi.AAC.1
MAEGEKKRFGNFAEYAKARQATKEQMPATGPNDQPRYMQQGMGIMGAQPGGMPVSQGMQQRTMGMGGIGGGMPSMQMNRGPMGMQQGQGMSSMGINRGGNPQVLLSEECKGVKDILLRVNLLPGTIVSLTWFILGMGGSAHQGMGGGMRGNAPNGNMQMGIGGYDGPSQVAFDPSDFPVLGRNPGTSSQSSHSQPMEGNEPVGSSSLNTQKEFSMEEDFPALPGAQAPTARSQQQPDDWWCLCPRHGRAVPAHETGKPGVCRESGFVRRQWEHELARKDRSVRNFFAVCVLEMADLRWFVKIWNVGAVECNTDEQ